jgi:glycosyltransferase involved in cell wall biosynthesis
MPLAMLEALAEGRPVVVSDAGNMALVVREARCGVVLASTAPTDIATTLRRTLSDRQGLVAAAENAHRAALERYSVSAAKAQLAEILWSGS